MAIVTQAYLAQISSQHRVISDLSREHQVSRTFIYDLLTLFKAECATLFFPKERADAPSQAVLEARMLAYRLEGRCSIDAISTLMKRDALSLSSQGSVSERLTRIGQALPDTLANASETRQFIVFANDEVYAKAQPILITVDPISSAILRIELADNRTADQWCQHYDGLLDNGFQPKQLISDAGVGICAANAVKFAAISWQLDTFHSVAHRLGDWNRRLEKRIDSAVRYAAEREATLASAKSEAVIDKRLTLCFEADRAVEKASQLHADFQYLYREIIQQLNLFDTSGHLRERNHVESTINAALALMEELSHQAINKAVASVRKALPDCLTYFDDAETAVQQCEKLTDHQETLTALCLAWQWDKAIIKSKQTDRKHHALEQRDFYLDYALLVIDDEEKGAMLKEKVYAELDQVIQASSMVECINSLLRPYLNNSKNQVTQAFLNLFMFYHNHRRYRAGKRKGKTPMEILTGKAQKEDWVALLQREIREKEPQLVA